MQDIKANDRKDRGSNEINQKYESLTEKLKLAQKNN